MLPQLPRPHPKSNVLLGPTKDKPRLYARPPPVAMPRIVRVFPESALAGRVLPRLGDGGPGVQCPLLARNAAAAPRMFSMDPVAMAAILQREADLSYDPIVVDPAALPRG